ncbi:TPA: DNA cytosine methyltransferase, partial [Staphylococcus aureus]
VNQCVVTNNVRIRKLTPLECWRLQGFNDEQYYKAKKSGVSESQLYKQAGNAVTVNVVEAIIKEIITGGWK